MNSKKIVLHYVRTWLLVDLLSVLPFDAMLPCHNGMPMALVRMLRGLALLRLLRAFRIWGRVQGWWHAWRRLPYVGCAKAVVVPLLASWGSSTNCKRALLAPTAPKLPTTVPARGSRLLFQVAGQRSGNPGAIPARKRAPLSAK